MALAYQTVVSLRKVKVGGEFKNKFKLTATMTDDADVDFVPITRWVEGYASTPEEKVDIQSRLAAKLNTVLEERADDQDAFGNIADTVNDYLTANVGV
jgi:hypothetical protein